MEGKHGVMSRSKNTLRNIIWGFSYQGVSLLFPFVIRTIILYILGEQYLGLNSLFASVVNVLNMAELGFSSAIVFSMYEPIAKEDKDTICALMALYKKVYRIIGTVVLVLGLSIMPFLKFMIRGTTPADINLYLLYGIYLFNSVISYFLFAYRTSLLSAHHRNDINSKISMAVSIVQYSVQIAILLICKNYYFYILMLPVSTVLNNVFNNYLAKKYYPEYVCRGVLEKKSKDNIKKQIGGLMVSKVCGTLRNSLDSIILSAFVGLTTVAVYSNYFYILNAVHGILTILGVSMKAGVGNSIAKETKEKNYSDYEKFTLIYMWISGWFACCMLCIYQPFMSIWTGKQSMVFATPIMIMFCVYFYAICMTDMRNVYMDAIGLWWEARYRSVFESVGNLVLNVVLGYYFGVVGIIVATLITLITINVIYGTKILFDNYFNEMNLVRHIFNHIKYFSVTAIAGAICYFICEILPGNIYVNLIARGLICVIVPNLIFVVSYSKDKSFGYVKSIAKKILKVNQS